MTLAAWSVVGLLFLLMLSEQASGAPLALHPENPHYFLYRGRPTVIIGSGEHYGAVLNLDFDYAKYLDTLAEAGLNHTRTFVGAYCEHTGAFRITGNTLAPAPGRFICPWARSDQPGYANGGNKFDLTRWDERYFARLKDFVRRAERRGIIVEINLFCPFYEEQQWALSPMNARNNINGWGAVPRDAVYTLDKSGELLAVQEAMTRQIVTELNSFDNVYFEVMNEPYVRGISRDWEYHMADVIVETEQRLPKRHLISMNIANHKAEIKDPHPAVSIFNFHYAFPPDTVRMNYGLNRVIGDNETGFQGTGDEVYRREAWAFILAGGGLFSHLDYSFSVGYEDGTFRYPDTQPGGGSAALRRQLRRLREFIESFDFVRMQPSREAVKNLPEGVAAEMLATPGRQYALYLYRHERAIEPQSASFSLSLAPGNYEGYWLDPEDGRQTSLSFQHDTRAKQFVTPPFAYDLALRLIRK